MGKPYKNLIFECIECKTIFHPLSKAQKFCSRNCLFKHNTGIGWEDRTCIKCGNIFKRRKSQVNKSVNSGKYCSRKCHANRVRKIRFNAEEAIKLWNEGFCYREIAKRVSSTDITVRKYLNKLGLLEKRYSSEKGRYNWKEGIRKSDYYRRLAFKYYPKSCFKCGYSKCPNVIEVHHLDGNFTNNSISNLRPVCPTCHDEIHFEAQTGKWIKKRRTKVKEPQFPNVS